MFFFSIDKSESDEDRFITLGKFQAEVLEGVLELDRNIMNQVDETLFVERFEIHIEIYCEFFPELEESEVEDESEEEVIESELEEDTAPVAVSEPFNSDQCVVCLSKKPELLFVNRLHRCGCLECEKTSPFRRCPSCRTHISIKVKI